MEKLGIESLSNFAVGAAELANVAGEAGEDGKLGLGDLPLLPKAATAANKLVTVDYAKAYKEFKDLDAEERKAVSAKFNEAFDIPQDKLEARVEEALQNAADVYVAVKKSVDMMKRWKEEDKAAEA